MKRYRENLVRTAQGSLIVHGTSPSLSVYAVEITDPHQAAGWEQALLRIKLKRLSFTNPQRQERRKLLPK